MRLCIVSDGNGGLGAVMSGGVGLVSVNAACTRTIPVCYVFMCVDDAHECCVLLTTPGHEYVLYAEAVGLRSPNPKKAALISCVNAWREHNICAHARTRNKQ